jgi:hypothetical protein
VQCDASGLRFVHARIGLASDGNEEMQRPALCWVPVSAPPLMGINQLSYVRQPEVTGQIGLPGLLPA